MVALKEKWISGRKYYYLIISTRVSGRVKKFYKYLGSNPPKEWSEKYKKIVSDFETEVKQKIKTGLMFLDIKDIAKLDELRNAFNKRKTEISLALVEKFKRDFMTTFTYNSNAIEGNEMSQKEVTTFLTEGIVPSDTNIRFVYETRNHAKAVKFIESYKGEFNKELLLKINKIILEDIWNEAGGRYRKLNEEVRIGDDIGCPSIRLEKEMKLFFDWYKKSRLATHPFELAVIAHFKLVEIHPFCDGNGRTARLIMNFILRKNKYPYLIILKRKQQQYYKNIRKARRENYYPLLKFCFKTMVNNSILNTLLGQFDSKKKAKNS